MRMVAISHLPQDFAALYQAASDLSEAGPVEGRWRWYVLQSALGLHGAPEAPGRLADHLQKAFREAKLGSFWTAPDETSEKAAADFGGAVLSSWKAEAPAELGRLLARGQALCLAQLLFKMVMPGFPDIYRGSEDEFLALTDPDNRRAVDWQSLTSLADGEGFGSEKACWTRKALVLRREQRDFLQEADAEARIEGQSITLIRSRGGRRLVAQLTLPHSDATAEGRAILDWTGPDGCRVSLLEQQ